MMGGRGRGSRKGLDDQERNRRMVRIVDGPSVGQTPGVFTVRHPSSSVTTSSPTADVQSTARSTISLTSRSPPPPNCNTGVSFSASPPLPQISSSSVPPTPCLGSSARVATHNSPASGRHAPPKTIPLIPLISIHAPTPREHTGAICPSACPSLGTASFFMPSIATPTISDRKSRQIPSFSKPSIRGNVAFSTHSNVVSNNRWATVTPMTSTVDVPLTLSTGTLGTAGPVTGLPLLPGMDKESLCTPLPPPCGYYVIGDAKGIPVDLIIADGLEPGSYLTEDEQYSSNVPGIDPRELVDDCIDGGVKPVVSFTAGKGSRLVEVVVPAGPEPRRYLWEERVLLKREQYTASDISATKESIRRFIHLKRELLECATALGPRHYADIHRGSRHLAHNGKDMTNPSWKTISSSPGTRYVEGNTVSLDDHGTLHMRESHHVQRTGAAGEHRFASMGQILPTQREPANGDHDKFFSRTGGPYVRYGLAFREQVVVGSLENSSQVQEAAANRGRGTCSTPSRPLVFEGPSIGDRGGLATLREASLSHQSAARKSNGCAVNMEESSHVKRRAVDGLQGSTGCLGQQSHDLRLSANGDHNRFLKLCECYQNKWGTALGERDKNMYTMGNPRIILGTAVQEKNRTTSMRFYPQIKWGGALGVSRNGASRREVEAPSCQRGSSLGIQDNSIRNGEGRAMLHGGTIAATAPRSRQWPEASAEANVQGDVTGSGGRMLWSREVAGLSFRVPSNRLADDQLLIASADTRRRRIWIPVCGEQGSRHVCVVFRPSSCVTCRGVQCFVLMLAANPGIELGTVHRPRRRRRGRSMRTGSTQCCAAG